MYGVDLRSTFGMMEMELAAAIIVQKALQTGSDKPVVYLECFPTGQESTGFLHLLHGGWMECFEYNGQFIPSKDFWEKIPEKYHPAKKEGE